VGRQDLLINEFRRRKEKYVLPGSYTIVTRDL